MIKLKPFAKQLGEEFKEDRATGLAAEQAYYYMLALFPMLILLLSILPYLSIEPQKALDFMESVMPSETTNIFRDNIIKIVTERNGGLLTFGILGTLWSASNGMNAFIHSMNIAFNVDETRSFIKVRLLSIVLTLGLILAFVAALLLPVFGNVILDVIKNVVPIPESMQILITVLRWLVAIVIIAIVLAVMYRYAPNERFPFKQVIPGAITATVLWQLISLGFSFYVSHFGNYSSTYGSLGGVIVLMLWLYLTGLVLVIGGEINGIIYRRSITATTRTSRKAPPITT
ncbi:YihY/virulence factor BrkB family protein [Peribacillus cavernae]|uniref:YihY/virulence factor BrkB family protein n=1 Tax=Peribacillus cavernae TaxID=1674310 RepID=A0A433HB71_9BACI|nr:YihY/virulence factor BrkB family protein [Peribacillus cavernae]RUQ25561.1 YihY/virulence factor BrkB family protein [Peribacillus cavernae]